MNVVTNTVAAVKALALLALLAGFGTALVFAPKDVNMTNDHSQTETVTAVSSKVMAQAAKGRTCSTEPTLTDTVVVQDVKTGETRIQSFDKTLADTKAGTVNVVTYCK